MGWHRRLLTVQLALWVLAGVTHVFVGAGVGKESLEVLNGLVVLDALLGKCRLAL